LSESQIITLRQTSLKNNIEFLNGVGGSHIQLKDSVKDSPIVNFKTPEEAKEIISFLIESVSNMVNFFNLKLNLSASQITDIAESIMDEFKDLSLSDIKVFCKRCKIGNIVAGGKVLEIGKVYDRLDGAMILGWLNIFREAKAIELEHQYQKEKNEQNFVRTSELDEEGLKKLQALIQVAEIIKNEPMQIPPKEKTNFMIPDSPVEKFDTYEPLIRAMEKHIEDYGVESAERQLELFIKTDPTNKSIPKMKMILKEFKERNSNPAT